MHSLVLTYSTLWFSNMSGENLEFECIFMFFVSIGKGTCSVQFTFDLKKIGFNDSTLEIPTQTKFIHLGLS